MKNKILTFSIFLMASMSCTDKNVAKMEEQDYLGVAKTVYSARLTGNLTLFKTVSTEEAYKQFKEEIDLMPLKNAQKIDSKDISIRTDTVVNNIAWVSLKHGAREVNSTLKLIRTNDGWKNDIYNIYKEKSPLKNKIVQFPTK